VPVRIAGDVEGAGVLEVPLGAVGQAITARTSSLRESSFCDLYVLVRVTLGRQL
jgi:hypothetical protein